MIVYLERSDLNEPGKLKHYSILTIDDFSISKSSYYNAREVHCVDDRGIIFKTLKKST